MKEKAFLFCAKCGSLEIKPIYFMESIDNRVQCMSCNTIGLPLEGSEKFWEKFLLKVKKHA